VPWHCCNINKPHFRRRIIDFKREVLINEKGDVEKFYGMAGV
jgi:hypothetical protein